MGEALEFMHGMAADEVFAGTAGSWIGQVDLSDREAEAETAPKGLFEWTRQRRERRTAERRKARGERKRKSAGRFGGENALRRQIYSTSFMSFDVVDMPEAERRQIYSASFMSFDVIDKPEASNLFPQRRQRQRQRVFFFAGRLLLIAQDAHGTGRCKIPSGR